MSNTLAWFCVAGAVAALLLYFMVWARRPSTIRLLNNSGLLFTGLGLGLLPRAFGEADDGRYAALAVGFLWLALLSQSVAAFRERRAWDGVDRREAGG